MRLGDLLGLARARGRGQRVQEARRHGRAGAGDAPAVARDPRPRLEHRGPARARPRQHRPGDRLRRRLRHRVPPVHALHARCPGRRSTPSTRRRARCSRPSEVEDADTHGQLRFNFRHPRIQNGEEGAVPAARLPARLRRERAERRAHRAHAAARLAEAAEATPTPACASASRSRRRTCGRSTAARSGPRSAGSPIRPALVARLRATRHGIARAFGWKARIAARIVGPVVYADALARGPAAAQGRDLRAADLLRRQPEGGHAAGADGARRLGLPLGRAARRQSTAVAAEAAEAVA